MAPELFCFLATPYCPTETGSIVSAEAFHFRVRDGNGWFHLAMVTWKRKYYST